MTDTTWDATLRLPLTITTSYQTTGGLVSHLEESFTYDARGLLLAYAQEDLLATSPSVGQVRTWTFTYETLASGLKVVETIDGPGLAANGVNDITSFEYNASGLLTKMTSPEGYITTYGDFSALGQPQLMTTPDATQTEYQYDFRGRVTAMIVDPAGSAWETGFEYDDIGQCGSARDLTPNRLPRVTLPPKVQVTEKPSQSIG